MSFTGSLVSMIKNKYRRGSAVTSRVDINYFLNKFSRRGPHSVSDEILEEVCCVLRDLGLDAWFLRDSIIVFGREGAVHTCVECLENWVYKIGERTESHKDDCCHLD